MSSSPQLENSHADQLRITISLGVIALGVGIYALSSPSNLILTVVRGAVIVQSSLAFLYILSFASRLKFNGTGSLFDIKIPLKLERFFYDQMIEMFWATLYAGLAGLILSQFSIKTVVLWTIGFLIACSILIFISVKRKSS
jgi:hypothetical protein